LLILTTISQQYLFTAVTCFITGYIPFISTEIILAGLGLIISTEHIIPLAIIGAIMQAVAKVNLYFISHKIVYVLKYKSKRKLIKLKQKYKSHSKLSASIIFTSALTGLPPYYFVNLLCGILNTGWLQFASLGFIGMFIRFSFCLACPKVILQIFS